MIQALFIMALIGITAPVLLDTKLKIDQSTIDQKMSLMTQMKILEMQQALLDESVCTENLAGHPVSQNKDVETINFLNASRDALDVAKKILAPKYEDADHSAMNANYDGFNVISVRLKAPEASALVGTAAGDSVLSYLVIESLVNGVVVKNQMPIYVEYDAANNISRCSARRRVRRC